MTQFTNRHGIDPVIASAISRDVYYGRPQADVTVSELVRPPHMAYLEMVHQHEIVEDVSERLFALLGSAIHDVLRRAAPPDALVEEYLTAEVAGWTVAGKPDYWKDGVLKDYKSTSVWSFLIGDKPDWELQLNLYAALYRRHGFEVDGLEISAILRDWSLRRAEEQEDYPAVPFMAVAVPLWPAEKAEAVLLERVTLHQEARAGVPKECSPAERWRSDDRYAVMKDGQKRAVRLFGADKGDEAPQTAAVELSQELVAKGFAARVETRPGASRRCQSYCRVRELCPQRGVVRKEEGW